jgi:hypothetical protein
MRTNLGWFQSGRYDNNKITTVVARQWLLTSDITTADNGSY